MLKKIEISDDLFTAFRDFVSAKMGLYFLDNKRQDLLRGVKHAADTFGYKNIETCITQLLQVDWTEKQIKTLASYLTVGETHFYRHREHLNYFVEKILRTSTFINKKSLNIWSAGCCTGDEAYTLAILLHENVPFINKYDISILATDINPVFLKKAKEAVFTRNSFRETPGYIQKKYFTHIGRDRHELMPKIKKMVKFRYLNLVSNAYPLKLNDSDSFDIIFCRNVFIYFKLETVAEICSKFKYALNTDGYLFVSPAETFMAPKNLFKKDSFKKSIIFQNSPVETKRGKVAVSTVKKHVTKPEKSKKLSGKLDRRGTNIPSSQRYAAASEHQASGIEHQASSIRSRQGYSGQVEHRVSKKPEKSTTVYDREKKNLSAAKARYNKGNYNESVKMLNELIKNTHSAEIKNSAYIELSRIYSNLGKADSSLECCKKAIDLDKMNPFGYFLYASLLMESGKIDESIDYFKKTLYFDNSYVIAHFTLGNIYLNFKKKTEAEKYFRNAEKLLSKANPSDVVKGSEGLTVNSMKDLIRACLGISN